MVLCHTQVFVQTKPDNLLAVALVATVQRNLLVLRKVPHLRDSHTLPLELTTTNEPVELGCQLGCKEHLGLCVNLSLQCIKQLLFNYLSLGPDAGSGRIIGTEGEGFTGCSDFQITNVKLVDDAA